MATFIQEGNAIDYTPGSNVSAGDVVVLSEMIGVAVKDIAANTLGALTISGVFEFAKAASDGGISAGDPCYWDAGNSVIVKDNVQGTHKYVGCCVLAAADAAVLVRVALNKPVDIAEEQLAIVQVEDLAADGDIADRPIFVHPRAVTLVSIGILTEGSPAGVDDSNTSVFLLEDDASNAIVTKTYNTGTQPPSSDYEDLGALSATHKVLAAGEHVMLSVTNGTNANLPAFSLLIRYIPANV